MKTKPKPKKQPPTTIGTLEIISAICNMDIQSVPGPKTDFPVGWIYGPITINITTRIGEDFSTANTVIINGTRFENFSPKRI